MPPSSGAAAEALGETTQEGAPLRRGREGGRGQAGGRGGPGEAPRRPPAGSRGAGPGPQLPSPGCPPPSPKGWAGSAAAWGGGCGESLNTSGGGGGGRRGAGGRRAPWPQKGAAASGELFRGRRGARLSPVQSEEGRCRSMEGLCSPSPPSSTSSSHSLSD